MTRQTPSGATLNRMLIILVVLAAAWVRISLVSTARFMGDEASSYEAALQIREGTSFPVLGPAVTGGVARVPGPLFYYLMSLSQFVSRSPEAANVEVAILGAASVGFVWAGVEALLGAFPAFVAALFTAFSPWAILSSDRIWSANGIFFLASVAFWAAVKVSKVPHSRLIGLLAAVSVIMPQFHLSAPVIWLALLAVVLPHWRHLNYAWLGTGILIGTMTYMPYIFYELETGFANLGALRAENVLQTGTMRSYKVVIYTFKFLTLDTTYFERMGYWGGVGERKLFQALLFGSDVRPFTLVGALEVWVSIVVAAMTYCVAFVERKRLDGVWSGLWVGVVADVALMSITRKPFYPHYLTVMLPFIFALGGALGYWMERNRRVRYVCMPLLAVWCIGGVQSSVAISRNLDYRNGLAVERHVIRLILADARKERWQAGTEIGLSFGFPGAIEAYQVLMRDSYHVPFEIVPSGRAVVRGGAAPEYSLEEARPGARVCLGPRLGGGRLVLCRER